MKVLLFMFVPVLLLIALIFFFALGRGDSEPLPSGERFTSTLFVTTSEEAGPITLTQTNEGVQVDGELQNIPTGEYRLKASSYNLCQHEDHAGDIAIWFENLQRKYVHQNWRRHGGIGLDDKSFPTINESSNGVAKFGFLSPSSNLNHSLLKYENASVVLEKRLHIADPSPGNHIACGLLRHIAH